ncbi:hypothetical protein [Mycoplasmopsis agassizii]|uniref:Uncharacterized protein n=2 Tax=Mycoplasmopsis agassizii TaxID=33922 RepID=A0ABX4H528_9BACT|nr:hypothetical protein [Mycoplasmopsis agassizii]PAF54968.1 hypothetical protein CJF60_04510 [Mycoplasmopsis agassizii]SMC20268.1 hypothetical protein SAMN02745179_01011 [Mycoplasmopsis agassizii]
MNKIKIKKDSKVIDSSFEGHKNIIIDCEDKEDHLRICIVSSDQLKQKTTKPPIKKMTINDLAVIVIQGFAKQEEANVKQDEFNKKVEAFMDKQMETNEKFESFMDKQMETNAKQEKFNEWVYDAITGLQKDVKRIDGVLEKNKIK